MADKQKGYTEETWRGSPRFYCAACPFDHADEARMRRHVERRHTEPEILEPERQEPDLAPAAPAVDTLDDEEGEAR